MYDSRGATRMGVGRMHGTGGDTPRRIHLLRLTEFRGFIGSKGKGLRALSRDSPDIR